ncbi:MAG: acyl-CoA dehydrogenase [Gammaproteobacteria bacterium]|nr:acyl-CoA dehydrogenase [Gammaproteobacteria bacterium]
MDYRLSEEQQALAELAARLFADHCDDEAQKRLAASGQPYDAALWAALADSGLLEFGAGALGPLEIALLLEQQGRWLARVPLPGTLAAAAVLARAGMVRPEPAAIATFALSEPVTLATAGRPGTRAVPDGAGWRLTGTKSNVLHGMEAAEWLVSVIGPNAVPLLFRVPRDTPGVSAAPQRTLSAIGFAELRLEAARLPDSARIPSATALRDAEVIARLGLAALLLGVLDGALHRTVEYVSQRRQFGRPIGSFQSVQHRLADQYTDLEALRAAVQRTTWCLETGRCAVAAASVAAWWAGHAAHRIGHDSMHLHGGVGVDIQYPIHRYLLWAKDLEFALGGPAAELARLGDAIAAGAAPRLADWRPEYSHLPDWSTA